MSVLPGRRALTVLFAVIVAVSAALLLAQDQETIQLKSDIAAEDPRDPEYLAALVNAPLSRGNRYDVLTNGDAIFPAMLAAIDGATRRISFETYVYESGEIADKFTAALERRSAAWRQGHGRRRRRRRGLDG